MKITPRGMSVQEAYRIFRDGEFLVNRRYQRKLVWTVEEKRRLIDSMLHSYPIPLILLAEHKGDDGFAGYEIIDGMQRLNAVFMFIENAYDLEGHYFAVAESARARQAAEDGVFTPISGDAQMLARQRCADLLDYQLAVTIYPPPSNEAVNEVFQRINANGRQLSSQERRQAGVLSSFADIVREIACELRGDVSRNLLSLTQMPEISVESKKTAQGYGIKADQHTEPVFRQIFGGCQAVVEGLGAVQNKLSDAHGGGKSRVRASARHAELAVNLSGAMATFLVSTLEAS